MQQQMRQEQINSQTEILKLQEELRIKLEKKTELTLQSARSAHKSTMKNIKSVSKSMRQTIDQKSESSDGEFGE